MPKDYQYNPKGNTYISILLHSVVSHNTILNVPSNENRTYRKEIFDSNNTSVDVILAGQSKACSRLRILSLSHFLTHPVLNLVEHRTQNNYYPNLTASLLIRYSVLPTVKFPAYYFLLSFWIDASVIRFVT